MTQQNLFDKIQNAYSAERPFVVFRYPGEESIKSYVLRDQVTINPSSETFSGFVLAPFYANNKAIGFAEAASEIAVAKQSVIPLTADHDTVGELPSAQINHIALVKKGKEFLQQTKAKKVVLSREIRQPVCNFDFLTAFSKLLNYANAFVYCWYHPAYGLWIGATPETLLRVNGEEFSTMALAGTQAHSSEKEINWGKKECYEQQVVTDYIVSQLAEIPLIISQPYTITAGNIAHIRTDVSGRLDTKLTLPNLIERLHPTPAVCGIPMLESREFIQEQEGYDRRFYTGYLGELRVQDQSKLFVNLRCMRIEQAMASIYVGGGITPASNPMAEYQETCEKAKLMLGLL